MKYSSVLRAPIVKCECGGEFGLSLRARVWAFGRLIEFVCSGCSSRLDVPQYQTRIERKPVHPNLENKVRDWEYYTYGQ